MAEFNPSLAILLSEKPLEPDTRKVIVTPLSSGESWLATVGLAARMTKLYKSINRDDNERPPQEIYGPLFNHIDEYRQRAIGFSEVLSPLSDSEPQPRAFIAEHIALLIQGQRLHKSKKEFWPGDLSRSQPVLEIYQDLLSADENDFEVKRLWAYQRARNNNLYWVRELQNNRGHRLANALRRAGVVPAAAATEV